MSGGARGARGHKTMTADLERYLATYLSTEIPQGPIEAETDSQLATIVPLLSDRISRHASGIIVDLGCGHGALLARLSDLPAFRSASDWLYLGVDNDDNLATVAKLARELRLNRRTEFSTLDSFYKTWPTIATPQIIFCRNVFHELNVAATSTLLRHVVVNFGADDEFIIQDLLHLPKGERHNACWTPKELEMCLQKHNFKYIQCTPQRTRSRESPRGRHASFRGIS